jgi:galactose oxidase
VPVGRVSLLRLGSVTHAMSMDQRFLWLDAEGANTELTVTAPANPMLCPPGPYLLFVLAENGVPSVGAMVRVTVAPVAPAALLAPPRMDVRAAEPRGTTVVIGIDGVCPYGIGACWGGANEALHRLTGVAAVDPDPDGLRSTAVVHLDNDGLPPLDRWEEDFAATANGSYQLRGYEITLEGDVDRRDGQVLLRLGSGRPDVELHPLRQLIQWDPDLRGREEPTPEERRAFENVTTVATGSRVHVTGPITKDRDSYRLEVRRLRVA